MKNKKIFALFFLLTFGSQEAWVSRVHHKEVSLSELTDQASLIMKVERISDLVPVKVKRESGEEVSLNYLKVKILEVIKSDIQAYTGDGQYSVLAPLEKLNTSLPLVGQTVAITDSSPLKEKPPKGKSYYVYQLANAAGLKDKVMFFFSTGYHSDLQAFPGLIEKGLVDLKQESNLQKALELRAFFDATRSGQIENLKVAFKKYPKAISDSDETWGTPLHFAARYGKTADVDFLVQNGGSLTHQNAKGNDVIHDLIDSGFIENLPHLLSLSRNLNVKNKSGQTYLDLAKESSNPQIQKWLESALENKK